MILITGVATAYAKMELLIGLCVRSIPDVSSPPIAVLLMDVLFDTEECK